MTKKEGLFSFEGKKGNKNVQVPEIIQGNIQKNFKVTRMANQSEEGLAALKLCFPVWKTILDMFPMPMYF